MFVTKDEVRKSGIYEREKDMFWNEIQIIDMEYCKYTRELNKAVCISPSDKIICQTSVDFFA